jgi:hypothetical protein
MPPKNLVVGENPSGERFERWASNSEVLLWFGRWGLAVLLATPGKPLIVDGYAVWIDR